MHWDKLLGQERDFHDFSTGSLFSKVGANHTLSQILFIIPEAIAAICDDNATFLVDLETLGSVTTITQADALIYPDWTSYSLVALGSNSDTAWNTANLAELKSVPNLNIICVDKISAPYLGLGVDGGDAAAKTAITAVANIKGSIIGSGHSLITGLAAGANTISVAATYCTLDMSDADITETWLAYESVNANTDVVIGGINRLQSDGSIGTDVDGEEVAANMWFYGAGYSYDSLTTLGRNVIKLLGEKLLQSSTVGQSVEISGNIGNVRNTIGTKASTAATGIVSNAKVLMAYLKQQVTNNLDVHTSGTIAIAGGTDFTSEQTMVEITVASNVKETKSIAIDLEYAATGFDAVATAGDILTVYVYHMVDGANYRQIGSTEYTAGSLENNVWITDIPSGRDVKVTAKVDTDRGAYDFPFSHVVVTNA